MTNAIKAYALLALLIAIVLVLGQAMGGTEGLVVAFVISLAMSFFSYWFSDSIVLSMYGAQAVERDQFPALHEIVERLAERAGIPKPAVYIIPSMSPNAFATGRGPSKSAVAVTEGLLAMLNKEELAGVLAHEIAHVANYDVLLSTLVATLAGSLSFVARMFLWTGGDRRRDGEGGSPLLGLLMIILAPLVATLIQLAISRSREYLADETGARYCGDPRWLASALAKLEGGIANRPMSDAEPATAHLFIASPFSVQGIMGWFSTHPPMHDRIERLVSMTGQNRG